MANTTEKLAVGTDVYVSNISDSEAPAATSGTLKGGAYARETSERRDVGNGRFQFQMEDSFIHGGGPTTSINDKTIFQGGTGEFTR